MRCHRARFGGDATFRLINSGLELHRLQQQKELVWSDLATLNPRTLLAKRCRGFILATDSSQRFLRKYRPNSRLSNLEIDHRTCQNFLASWRRLEDDDAGGSGLRGYQGD